MNHKFTIKDIEKLVKKAKTPQELFGKDPPATLKEMMIALHPDRNLGDAHAADLLKQIDGLYQQLSKPKSYVKSKKRIYELNEIFRIGDVSDVHKASNEDSKYIVKISRVPGGDRLLDNERTHLAKILTSSQDTHYCRYFPTLVESFVVRSSIQKRVNVFVQEDGFFTLDDIKKQYPGGLHGRHIAWIFKRLLTALGVCHSFNIIHSAILPQHILIHPKDHGLELVGFGQSVTTGSRITNISAAYKNWYPEEVFKKQNASVGTDIFMAAKCMEDVCNMEVHTKIKRFLSSCLLSGQSMRPDNSWKLMDEWNEMLLDLFGSPKFVELSMV